MTLKIKFISIVKFKLLGISLLFFVLSGCLDIKALYNPDIRQGNFVSCDCIKNLKIGLSKEKVIEVIGKPTLIPISDINCWCYYYYNIPGFDKFEIEKKILCLYFFNDLLAFYTLDV